MPSYAPCPLQNDRWFNRLPVWATWLFSSYTIRFVRCRRIRESISHRDLEDFPVTDVRVRDLGATVQRSVANRLGRCAGVHSARLLHC